MNEKDNTKQEVGTTLVSMSSIMQERYTDILILYYKNKMTIGSLSRIFAMNETQVSEIISTFAEQFSNVENLHAVVEGLIRMKKHRKTSSGGDIDPVLAAKDSEIAELRRRLTESQIKAEAYEQMVKTAEEAFRIPIRKKFGAK